MGGVIAPSGCHVPPWCGDREGWLPWWRLGTVDPFEARRRARHRHQSW